MIRELVATTSRSSGSRANDRLADLYLAHSQAALRLAYLLTGDSQVAEDIVQDAFTRVGGRILGLKEPERAAGYLFRTVSNLAKGHGRRLRNDRRLKERLGRSRDTSQADAVANDHVWRALMGLPIRQRTALFLRYYLDMSESDAASAMDCSPAAMKSLTHRASESLARNLKEDEHE